MFKSYWLAFLTSILLTFSKCFFYVMALYFDISEKPRLLGAWFLTWWETEATPFFSFNSNRLLLPKSMLRSIRLSRSCSARWSPCVPLLYNNTPSACDVLNLNLMLSLAADIGSRNRSIFSRELPLKYITSDSKKNGLFRQWNSNTFYPILPYSQPNNSTRIEMRSRHLVGLIRIHCAIIGTSNSFLKMVSPSVFPLNIYKIPTNLE